jgi:hypothetical protein
VTWSFSVFEFQCLLDSGAGKRFNGFIDGRNQWGLRAHPRLVPGGSFERSSKWTGMGGQLAQLRLKSDTRGEPPAPGPAAQFFFIVLEPARPPAA